MSVGAFAEELVSVVLIGLGQREILDPFVDLPKQRLILGKPFLSRVHRHNVASGPTFGSTDLRDTRLAMAEENRKGVLSMLMILVATCETTLHTRSSRRS